MAKAKRPKAKKSDQPLEEDLSAENLETTFAVSDSKITVRRDGGKVVVSVPVMFYRRNGRQMILADSIESESDLDESGLPNNALLTAMLGRTRGRTNWSLVSLRTWKTSPKRMVLTVATLGECSN
jgi:hypothetical protein